MTYPSGRQVIYSRDIAGRFNGINGALQNQNPSYASNIKYTPFDTLATAVLGNSSATETWGYNARMQPTSLSATNTTTTLLSVGYNYCPPAGCSFNNGNPQSQTITRPNGTWTDTYTYDSLNRLALAQETGTGNWSENYGHDAYGNNWISSTSGVSLTVETPT